MSTTNAVTWAVLALWLATACLVVMTMAHTVTWAQQQADRQALISSQSATGKRKLVEPVMP